LRDLQVNSTGSSGGGADNVSQKIRFSPPPDPPPGKSSYAILLGLAILSEGLCSERPGSSVPEHLGLEVGASPNGNGGHRDWRPSFVSAAQ